MTSRGNAFACAAASRVRAAAPSAPDRLIASRRSPARIRRRRLARRPCVYWAAPMADASPASGESTCPSPLSLEWTWLPSTTTSNAPDVFGVGSPAQSVGVLGLDGILLPCTWGRSLRRGRTRGGAVSVAGGRRRTADASAARPDLDITRDTNGRVPRSAERTSASTVRDVNLDHIRERGVSADEGTFEYRDGGGGASECVTMTDYLSSSNVPAAV